MTLGQMRREAEGRRWTVDSVPDPDQGLFAHTLTFDGPLSTITLTLRCGYQLTVHSYRGLKDCEEQMSAIFDEIT